MLLASHYKLNQHAVSYSATEWQSQPVSHLGGVNESRAHSLLYLHQVEVIEAV